MSRDSSYSLSQSTQHMGCSGLENSWVFFTWCCCYYSAFNGVNNYLQGCENDCCMKLYLCFTLQMTTLRDCLTLCLYIFYDTNDFKIHRVGRCPLICVFKELSSRIYQRDSRIQSETLALLHFEY